MRSAKGWISATVSSLNEKGSAYRVRLKSGKILSVAQDSQYYIRRDLPAGSSRRDCSMGPGRSLKGFLLICFVGVVIFVAVMLFIRTVVFHRNPVANHVFSPPDSTFVGHHRLEPLPATSMPPWMKRSVLVEDSSAD